MYGQEHVDFLNWATAGYFVFGLAVIVTLLIVRRAMDDPEARAPRRRDRFR